MRKDDTKRKEVPEREIDIIPILKELLKKLWLIILVGLILGGAVFVGTKVLIKPTYRSGFTAYVNNKQGKESTDFLSSSDVTASKQLVLTYQKILTSNTILTAAAKSMELDASYNTLQKLVSTEVKDETEIISVFVVDTDPQFAYDYAQAISKTAPQYMAQIVEGSSMKIIDYPEFSDKRYKPSYSNFALIGFLIGALIVVVFVIIRYFMDDTVKSESDIESSFSIPILGVIPDVSKASNNYSDYYYYSQNSEDKKSESEQKDEEK
ncbi:MAG: Wzz/FepE/Etk N-terminal domain-containing protein [Oscillospiraceae bacterium]|nr:Wzz/FepE/Etk N-terminal domain-containing protein [Oscillospiraceae bacterium]